MKAVGGYFELERGLGKEYYANLLKLNTGRNCLEYLLRASSFKKIYLPKFSCKVLLEPINKLNVEYEYYSIDQNLNPLIKKAPEKNEAFLYINYFGVKLDAVKVLSGKIENLIVDNSQAFFADCVPAIGTFYSARKFFGVADGAYLQTNLIVNDKLNVDFSWDRMGHLLKRSELDAEFGYPDFKENSSKLSNQPILHMSKLTQSILAQIDYLKVRQIREENFRYLHQQLSHLNQFDFSNLNVNAPMVYPLYVENENLRKQLIQNRIFVASYWPNVLEDCLATSLDYKLAKYTFALPIDQRYTKEDMKQICNVVMAVLKENHQIKT